MTSQTPAGWYPDPYGSPHLRWWDGNQWTDATHPMEQGPTQQPPSEQQQPGSPPLARPADPAQPADPVNPTIAYGQPNPTIAFDQPNPTLAYGQPPVPQGGPGRQPWSPAPGQPSQPHQPHQHGAPWSGPGGPGAPGGPGGPGGQQPPWGGPGLPGPGYGPPPKRSNPMPWIIGGAAALVVLALLVVAGVFFVSNASAPSAAPTTSEAPPRETEEPPATSEPPQTPPQTSELPQPQSGRITDAQAGISYAVPEGWDVPRATHVNGTNPADQQWTSGVQKVSHAKYDGQGDWIGNIYTGRLHELYPYAGAAGLGSTAKAVFADFSGKYYQLPHKNKIVKDEATKIGGRDAWVLRFELDFTEISEAKDYKWKKENGAVVLMDRGEGERPALIYVSVPDNLGTDVVDQVVSSLQPA